MSKHNLKMEFEIESCDTCTKNDNISSIPVLSKDFSYNDFLREFMQPNLPCIIRNVTDNWEANSKWVTGQKTPNIAYLRDKYSTCDVTIYKCNERHFNSQKTETCKFTTFIENWGSENSKLEYLKDWHLKNTHKDDNFYEVPIYFASDWLNEFLIANFDDDYRFVYMGQAGTWTPFHSDVFSSYSWSANVCGRKKWIFFPPGEENSMRDSLNNLPYDISEIYKTCKHFEVVQNPGEAVFVPSGWYHQVWNLEDTISVNHNWVNGCNIMAMWVAIEENLRSVKHELQDCEDMDDFTQQCQIVLKASFGMDFWKFFDFLKFIATRRISQIRKREKEILFHGHILGLNHAIFDLKSLQDVLGRFLDHDDVPILFEPKGHNPNKLLAEIKESLL